MTHKHLSDVEYQEWKLLQKEQNEYVSDVSFKRYKGLKMKERARERVVRKHTKKRDTKSHLKFNEKRWSNKIKDEYEIVDKHSKIPHHPNHQPGHKSVFLNFKNYISKKLYF